jgi:hypothetical protein
MAELLGNLAAKANEFQTNATEAVRDKFKEHREQLNKEADGIKVATSAFTNRLLPQQQQPTQTAGNKRRRNNKTFKSKSRRRNSKSKSRKGTKGRKSRKTIKRVRFSLRHKYSKRK